MRRTTTDTAGARRLFVLPEIGPGSVRERYSDPACPAGATAGRGRLRRKAQSRAAGSGRTARRRGLDRVEKLITGTPQPVRRGRQ
jgi:hypothetical protein